MKSERDTWNPAQYDRFKAERQQPFVDLLAMVRPEPGMSVVDLGCGTGELTAMLHERLAAATTLGLDLSPAMLAKAAAHAGAGIEFRQADIGVTLPGGPYDLVFSNAALHWLPNHLQLLQRLTEVLSPSGQLAVQVPANHNEATHEVAARVAAMEPFRTALAGWTAPVHVLTPADYARALHGLGYAEQRVELRVYGHVLPQRDDVVEWVKGTTLTSYRERLADDLYDRFLAEYARLLAERLADTRPFFFPFSRILFWARRDSGER